MSPLPRRNLPGFGVVAKCLPFGVLAAAATAWSVDPQPRSTEVVQPPAEETRLNAVQFREALKKRGLSEILELHLKDFPPTNAATTLLLLRDVKLAEFADASWPVEQRQSAIREANRILQQLVEDNPEDTRRFHWQYTLGQSLLYEEAEPFSTNIFYFGGNDDDRARLTTAASLAREGLRSLAHRLQDELTRIERLPMQEFENLEQRGYVDELDRLALSTDYLLLWALFYDALPRREDDPTRIRGLNEIIETLAIKSSLLETPHERSRVQVPALLLSGMTHRRLNDHASAREHLNRVIDVAQRLTDVVEKERVQWAVTLATVEMIHNDRDDGRFKEALAHVARFRKEAESGGEEQFGLRLVGALLEKSIREAQANAAEKAVRSVESAELRAQAWKTLAQLAAEAPDRRDAIYAALYRLIPKDADVERLDPFEQCAYIAGLIAEADPSSEASRALLDRAVAAGEKVLSRPSGGARSMAPELLYRVAVAEYRRGNRMAAASGFVEAARHKPPFDRALNSATLGVQLSAELYHDAARQPSDEISALYREALEVLLGQHADTDAGRYWRFYYAQLLDELGKFDAAAEQFSLVNAAHEHYVASGFLRIRALAAALHRAAASSSDAPSLVIRADDILSAYREFRARAGSRMSDGTDASTETSARSLLAEARVITAETAILPQIDRSQQALELLLDFEKDYAQESKLLGRVWRVRLLAYEAMGQLEEASRAIPAYVASAPDTAGAVLRELYAAMTADVEKLRAEGNEAAAQRKSEVALLMAEQLDVWARSNEGAGGVDRREVRVQSAEANLRAGRYEQARALFDECAALQAPQTPPTETDLRIAFGQAEARFQLGQFADALTKFNRLATSLAPTHFIRWKSLLRDLECRSKLGEPAAGIIKVIEQQRFLHPDLGGRALAAEFERLLRESERRPAP